MKLKRKDGNNIWWISI